MYAVRPSWIASAAAAVTVWTLSSVAVAADTRNAEDWFREGVDKLGAGKLDEATTAFQFCVQYKPDMKECWYNLGVAWGRRRDFANEAKAYLKAVEIDPTYGRAHFNLAVAYEDLGTEAIRRLEVVDFPAVVAYDAAGGCVYDRVRDKSGAL